MGVEAQPYNLLVRTSEQPLGILMQRLNSTSVADISFRIAADR
jgi:hypothetical protein